jgi:predicted transcriptional regulator
MHFAKHVRDMIQYRGEGVLNVPAMGLSYAEKYHLFLDCTTIKNYRGAVTKVHMSTRFKDDVCQICLARFCDEHGFDVDGDYRPSKEYVSTERFSEVREVARQLRQEYRSWVLDNHAARTHRAILFEDFLGFMSRLTSTDVRLYIYLAISCNKVGEVWKDVPQIAYDVKLGHKTVQTSLKRLADAGLIVRLQASEGGKVRTFLRPYGISK